MTLGEELMVRFAVFVVATVVARAVGEAMSLAWLGWGVAALIGAAVALGSWLLWWLIIDNDWN